MYEDQLTCRSCGAPPATCARLNKLSILKFHLHKVTISKDEAIHENVTFLYIHFSSMSVESIEEVPMRSFAELVANFGGFLGN